MLNYITNLDQTLIFFLGLLFAFVVNFAAIAVLNKYLPRDMGRQFAHEGAISAGKPRGAGLIFVIVFVISAILFAPISVEIGIYLALIVVEMLTGFFDDAAETPWGEYLKGALDFIVSIVVAVTYIYFNGSVVHFAIFNAEVKFPPIVFGILAVILVWVSINVTNCTDGVDGLSATLTCISLVTLYVISSNINANDFQYCLLLFVAVLLGYLWFNSTPSLLLMGDAGSRAQGVIIAIAALKTGSPFLYLLAAIVFIVDGGLGLVKVSLLRFLKIHILKNTTTPIHDHVRKKIGWSNTQCVYRFAIIQLAISAATVYLSQR